MITRALPLESLNQVSGGIQIPRLPDEALPQQRPENYDFFAPYVERDMSYRPERDGEPQTEEPVLRYGDEEAPAWTQPAPEQEASYQGEYDSYGSEYA